MNGVIDDGHGGELEGGKAGGGERGGLERGGGLKEEVGQLKLLSKERVGYRLNRLTGPEEQVQERNLTRCGFEGAATGPCLNLNAAILNSTTL